MQTDLSKQPISEADGIGPAREEALIKSKGLSTIGGLLRFYPRDYLDYQSVTPVQELDFESETEQVVIGAVTSMHTRGHGQSERLIVTVEGEEGSQINMIWFRGVDSIPYVIDRHRDHEDDPIAFAGTPERFNGSPQMAHPDMHDVDADSIHFGRIVPLYSSGEAMEEAGLSTKVMRRVTWDLLSQTPDEDLPHVRMPETTRTRRGLMEGARALREVHWPSSQEALGSALERLKYEELFAMQLLLTRLSQMRGQAPALAPKVDSGRGMSRVDLFRERLPFVLTGAQEEALEDILRDMGDLEQSGNTVAQMNRLLQGDVGSGKTVVAVGAMLRAGANGKQSAFMAPTQILAEQHYERLQEYEGAAGLSVELLVGSQTEEEQEAVRQRVASGAADAVVGTHALIQNDTQFEDLGLAVIDEQQRFGVAQRRRLFDKNDDVHMLLMTATPIPRSLALGLYGDLQVSTIDEMPPGRQPVDTRAYDYDNVEQALTLIRQELASGGQAFVVSPMIGPGDTGVVDAKSQTEFMATAFPNHKVACMHGQMDSAKKSRLMAEFEAGDIDILSTTTVVEVGVDIPGATVMMVMDADRFGLSQLHQLRGRVGRAGQQAYCLLVADTQTVTGDGKQRLDAMTDTTDGFEIAQRDLEIRGIGQFFGTEQSGIGRLQVANPRKDSEMMEKCKADAEAVFAEDSALQHHPHLAQELDERFEGYDVELAAVG
jgi:ATP-dependent DNA helicase RecG